MPGTVIALLYLVSHSPRAAGLEELALRERPAQRIVTIDNALLDSCSVGLVSTRKIIPETPFSVDRPVVVEGEVGIDGGVRIVDGLDAVQLIVGVHRRDAARIC